MASYRIRGNSTITLVFLDTNAIFSIFEFSINLTQELTRLIGAHCIQIPKAVVNEIKTIQKKGKGKQKRLAKPALEFIQQYPVYSHKSYQNADDALVFEAAEVDAVVVTNDKPLRDRLKEKKVSRIFLRGKQQLVLEK
jgi:hypothetical protein